ncbi:MAG: TonB-dependent receptor, partial [Pseudomonadales bacterium]
AVGNLVGKQFAKDSKFQPKLQLAYHWTKDLMLYSTWAKGFRSGFFNTGRSTRAEQTDNVEIGFKQTAHAGRVQINGAVFYTDYSDQQLTSAIAQAPFRVTTNIPKSTIKGAEFDITAKVGQRLKINAALGYIDTEINDIHLNTPATPDWTANVGILHSQAIDNGINWINRLDYIYQGEMYLHLEAPPLASEYRQRFWVDAKEYLNIRSSIELKNWRFSAFVNNVLQTQQATDFTDFGGKFVRSYNKPRAWGIAAEYRF